MKDRDQTKDALNLNNSMIASISDDVANSMQPFIKMKKAKKIVSGSPPVTTYSTEDTFRWNLGDMSSYFSGIPFTDSGIFQGGLSHNGGIMLAINKLGESEVPKKCTAIKLAEPVCNYSRKIISNLFWKTWTFATNTNTN